MLFSDCIAVLNSSITVLYRPFHITIYTCSHISKFSNSLTQLTSKTYVKKCIKLPAMYNVARQVSCPHNTVSGAAAQNPPLYVSVCSVYEYCMYREPVNSVMRHDNVFIN